MSMFGRKRKKEAASSAAETIEDVNAAAAAEQESAEQESADSATDAASKDAAAERNAGQESAQDAGEATSAKGAKAPAKSERANGPLDASEVDEDAEGYLDLGSLRIRPVTGMNLNLEVEQESQAIVAVSLELDDSRVQLQAFSAPKSEGLWAGISSQIDQSVTAQGGRTDRREGRFGQEILARVPSTGPDGSQGVMIARFVGVDGPRWFLRAVFGGAAALNEEAAAPLEDILSTLVVDRGQQPLPPAELLPLSMPQGQQAAPADADAEQPADGAHGEFPEGAPRRGPEITEIG